MQKRYSIEDLQSKLKWCQDYVDYFRQEHDFDPLEMLQDTETKEQKIFGICACFEDEVQNAIDDLCKKFDEDMKKFL